MIQRLTTTLLLLLLTARLCGAAITAATLWEVRPTNGDNTFGSCFDSTIANAGTDYSQQTTAQLALTDIAITTTAVTSVTGGFTAAMIGNCLRLNATGTGAHCVIGWYQITAFTSSNAVTIDRDATTGGAGVACSGKVGGATKSVSGQTTTALVASSGGAVAGNTIYVKNEAWNEAVTLTVSGTSAVPLTLEGYNSTRGDAPTGSNRPRNNKAASGVPFALNGTDWLIKHIWASNAGATGGFNASGTGIRFLNCRSSNNTGFGFSLAGDNRIINSEADNNTTFGITLNGSKVGMFGVYAHANTSAGIALVGQNDISINFALATANTGPGISSTLGSGLRLILTNSTMDGNTGATSDGFQGVGIMQGGSSLFYNNIFSNNGRDGARITNAGSVPEADYNNFFGNSGTARTNFPTGTHDIALTPGYVNSGSGNYAVGANMRNKGWPGVFPASTSTGFLDIGAVQTGIGGATQRAIGCVQ